MSNKAMSWAVDCRVKGSHKLVLMLLAEAHNGQTGECFPSQDWMVQKSGLGISTVQACLKDLEKWGLLARETKRLGRGNGSRTNYHLSLQKLDPQILDVQNSGNRPPDSTRLDPQISGVPNKDKPESNRKEPETRERVVFEKYNEIAERVGWVKATKLTDDLKRKLGARIKDHGEEQVIAFMEALAEQPWTSKGFNGNNFRASLAFIVRPRTFTEHFDKLVGQGSDLLSQPTQSNDGPESYLEHCFRVFAQFGDWRGAQHGHYARPDSPDADYPAELYAKFNLQKPQMIGGAAA